MKLYFFMIAPNPTRVRLYLAEKAARGTSIELEQVPVSLLEGEQKGPEHLARNPLGKLPVLELDDGSYLTESLAIIEYLEELYPESPMIGTDPQQRARVRRLERIAETGVLAPVAFVVHTTNSPLGSDPVPEVAAYFREAMGPPLRVLEDCLSDGRSFVAGGEHATIADCTLAAALQFGRFGKFELDASFANLLRWDAAYRQRSEVRDLFLV